MVRVYIWIWGNLHRDARVGDSPFADLKDLDQIILFFWLTSKLSKWRSHLWRHGVRLESLVVSKIKTGYSKFLPLYYHCSSVSPGSLPADKPQGHRYVSLCSRLCLHFELARSLLNTLFLLCYCLKKSTSCNARFSCWKPVRPYREERSTWKLINNVSFLLVYQQQM